MNSIRRQLLFSLLIGFLVLLLGGGYLCHRIVRDYMDDALDRSLLTKAQALAALVEPEVFGVEFNFSKETMPEYASPESGDFFEIWTDDGKISSTRSSI